MSAPETENAELREQLRRQNIEIKRLTRELRVTKGFLEKVTRASEAKDAMGSALSKANARQKAYTDVLLENCPNIIVLMNIEKRFVLSTNALLEVTGIPNFDFIKNLTYKEVFCKYFTDEVMKKFENAINSINNSNEIANFEDFIDFSADGNPSYYAIEFRRIDSGFDESNDIMSGILIVMTDLTAFMSERQRAEEANNAKSDFLAAMSHEIRTPMNAIFGMCQALARSNLDEHQKKYILDINKASDSLLSIINDILDLSKIETGKMEAVNVNYSLVNMLDNLKAMFAAMFDQTPLKLIWGVSPEIPRMAYGDENRVRQILTNLLSNALKYTIEGQVVFHAWLDGNKLCFKVKDSGIGIKEADKAKLFKPFEQLDARKNRNVVGTGLGLTICYNLCLMLGGSIEVESVYGKGSVFTAILPYAESGAESDEEIDARSFSAPDAKVLVVDDMEINLIVAEAVLEAFDIIPDTVNNGIRAMELAKKINYDIIFMDHMMPDMDGIEATKNIRMLGDRNERVPIIALTANIIDGAKQMFMEHGMDDVLAKPIELDKLIQCLRKWLPTDVIMEVQE